MSIMHSLDRWLYRGGRPNRLARALNRAWSVAHSAGLWPRRLATLEVPGRRTGRIISLRSTSCGSPATATSTSRDQAA